MDKLVHNLRVGGELAVQSHYRKEQNILGTSEGAKQSRLLDNALGLLAAAVRIAL